MPIQQASLAITDRYRAGMVGIRERAKREAAKTWNKIDPDDLDGTYPVGMLALLVGTLQREAARLSSAYLGAYITSELGRPIRDPIVDARQVGSGRSGGDLKKVLRGPLIDVKVAIRGGKTPAEGLAVGRTRLVRMVGLATDTAAREALRTGMDASSHIIGWRRAVRGTCGACVGMADGSRKAAGEPLEIHPDCQCVAEPQVQPRFGDPKALKTDSGMSEASEQAIGTWRSPYYKDINQALRDPDNLVGRTLDDEQVGRAVSGLDDLFRGTPKRDQPLKLYRGLEKRAEDVFPDVDNDSLIGSAIDDAGFASATDERAIAERFTRSSGGDLLELTVDPSVRARRLEGGILGAETKAPEILLERQLRYVVSGIRSEGKGRIVEMIVSAS